MAARFRMRIAAIIAGLAPLSACAVAPPPIPADPQAASKMSLEDAKDTIQRGIRWVWSDGTGDHDFQVWEFAVDRIDSYIFARNGRTARYTSCPYEAFDPYVIADNGVFFFGVHKGQAASAAFLGGGDCGSWAGISVPTPDRANHVAAALLRWKTSTLAERQAYFAEQQQGFASIAANYRNTTPRPPVPEDLRRVQVVAEEAVREERFVEAADAYERALEHAPWWPEGQFNLALILGELYYYDEAIEHMQDFLALVPDAPNARHWQDQVYRWQGELRSIRGASNRRTRTVAAR